MTLPRQYADEQARHDAMHPGKICMRCPIEIQHRAELERPLVDHSLRNTGFAIAAFMFIAAVLILVL